MEKEKKKEKILYKHIVSVLMGSNEKKIKITIMEEQRKKIYNNVGNIACESVFHFVFVACFDRKVSLG